MTPRRGGGRSAVKGSFSGLRLAIDPGEHPTGYLGNPLVTAGTIRPVREGTRPRSGFRLGVGEDQVAAWDGSRCRFVRSVETRRYARAFPRVVLVGESPLSTLAALSVFCARYPNACSLGDPIRGLLRESQSARTRVPRRVSAKARYGEGALRRVHITASAVSSGYGRDAQAKTGQAVVAAQMMLALFAGRGNGIVVMARKASVPCWLR